MMTRTLSPVDATILSDPTFQDTQVMAEAALANWQGCDWDTAFGPSKLNLNGMKPHQARLLAEATSGDESKSWDAATIWLANVERDAKCACTAAARAVSFCQELRFPDAMLQIEKAIDLEARYRQPKTWNQLRKMIVRHVSAEA